MALLDISLADKYTLEKGRVFLTGTQALVRLPMMQQRRDATEGYNTGCYISGYRGSPLGGFDQQLTSASKLLKDHNIHFQPGVNEDLAATACWGSQQTQLSGQSNFDGVFAIWYGKGPGVDRTGDVFRHGNLAGTSPKGGVIALMGDDHTCESSTTAHQSEFAMVDAMMPILNPAGVQELLDYGLYGWALSRYSGCWVGLKSMKDTIDATASVDVDPARVKINVPTDFTMPPGGIHIRFPDVPLEQEARLHNVKIEAVKAFARANAFDRVVIDSPTAKLGIATCGKSYMDVRQALQYLGIDDAEAQRLGLRVYKIGMTWPLEPEGARRFAQGLDKIIVVEEKRGLIEPQLKDILYGMEGAPAVIGKRDEQGAVLFASNDALDPNHIAITIGERILDRHADAQLSARVAEQQALETRVAEKPAMDRTPYFCAGCPHNTGTKVPEGSRALAGIGCHFMAQWMDRNTAGYTQMGGEGAGWMGEAPFVKTKHIFQNIGDGTYFHSGYLAVRAAVASGVTMTYKILYNDAVAMTGGQHVDGQLTVPQVTRQVAAEGAKRIAVVTDEPEKYGGDAGFAPGVTVHHRDDYDAVQRELREVTGISVIVYDQTCAAEKRRRRKRGQYPDPPKRVFINDLVCEGCGDCGVKSNCVAVTPLETEFGRKRVIDQSACNKDYSCVSGFCPSFVTVHGGGVRKAVSKPAGEKTDVLFEALPEPVLPSLDEPYGILVTGVGGTGVVTIGAIVGMAAHIEGLGFRRARHGRTRPEGRGGVQPSADRRASRPHQDRAARIRWREAGARLRSGGQRQPEGDGHGAPRHANGGQPASADDRRIHPRCQFPVSVGVVAGDDRQERRRWQRRVRGRHPRCNRPDGRFDRDQHVHARLCLPARAAAGVRRCDQQGHRAQRCRRQDEPGGIPVGAPRRCRFQGGGEARGAEGREDPEHQGVRDARRDPGAPDRVPDAIPGRRLGIPLPQAGRRGAHRRGTEDPRKEWIGRGGGPLLLQADGLQG